MLRHAMKVANRQAGTRFPRRWLIIGAFVAGIAAVLLAFPIGSYGRASDCPPCTWSGTWSRAEDAVSGDLILTQDGANVSGYYTWNDGSGRVSGTVSGTTYTGGFSETNYDGSFVLTLSGDGQSFTGSYDGENKNTHDKITGPFDGQCIGGDCLNNGKPPPPPPPQPPPPPPPTGRTVTVAAPAPGTSTSTESPALPAGDSASFDIPPSDDPAFPMAITLEGNTEKVKKTVGQLVFWCWLNSDDLVAELGDEYASNPGLALLACSYLVSNALLHKDTGQAAPPPPDEGDLARFTTSVSPKCRMRPFPILLTVKKGKVAKTSAAKGVKLPQSFVHYTCSVAGDGTIRIKVRSGSSLRKALGKKIDFSVYRPKSAPKNKTTLSIKFNW